jgi:alditol oxidase
MTNWSGNLTYSAKNFYEPLVVEELQELVRRSAKIRALGSRHSFNAIADSNDSQVSLARFNHIHLLDKEKNTMRIGAGIKYGELCVWLNERGFALHNLASLPHISVAGACATATHGSGIKNESLASAVRAVEFVNANGDLISVSREKNAEEFYGAVVNLGVLGIMTSLTLEIQPAFNMKQYVYEEMPVNELGKNFETIMSEGYSVSLFTDWSSSYINQVWIKTKDGSGAFQDMGTFYQGRAARMDLHPLKGLSAEHCTSQLGITGSWYERMPHFKMGFTPSGGKELQSEYFIPFEHAYKGLLAIGKLAEKISPHLFVSEIRAIAADAHWMSPFYKNKAVAFHFTWKQEWDEVQKLLPLIEEALSPFYARPHWAKLFSMQPRVLQSRIEKLKDFRELVLTYDPGKKFSNAFTDHNLFGR